MQHSQKVFLCILNYICIFFFQDFTLALALSIAACTLGSSFQFGYNTGIVNAPEKVNEPPHGKTNNVVFEKVRHKPGCMTGEDS